MSSEADSNEAFVVGWEEWLALPDLGLPAIRAKIDTGAKTSALHAFAIEPFETGGRAMVRFGVHPVPERQDIARYCTAAVADRREVTSSNGEREVRFVIRTRLILGGRDWGEIETTLANRESMAYRMLLGRQALRGGMLVDPQRSFLQPRLSHRLYAGLPRQETPHRSLRIALVASKPARPSNRRLANAARQRGHRLDILPLDELELTFDGPTPRLTRCGQVVGRYDAVLARASGGRPRFAPAVVRHLEQTGAVALNPAEALSRLRDPFAVASRLQSAGLAAMRDAAAHAEPVVLTLAGEPIASKGAVDEVPRQLAARAARTLDLGLASLALARDDGGWRISSIDANPSLGGYDGKRGIATDVVEALEAIVRRPVVVPAAAEPEA